VFVSLCPPTGIKITPKFLFIFCDTIILHYSLLCLQARKEFKRQAESSRRKKEIETTEKRKRKEKISY
jgi:hypothetical protein